jgi:hypothetical protein
MRFRLNYDVDIIAKIEKGRLRHDPIDLSHVVPEPNNSILITPKAYKKIMKKSWPVINGMPASGVASNIATFVNKHIPSKRQLAIAAHEQMHAMFNSVETMYGKDAKDNLIKHLTDKVHPIAFNYMANALYDMGYSEEHIAEEVLLYLHTIQEDSVNANRIKKSLNSETKWALVKREAEKSWADVLKACAEITKSQLQKNDFQGKNDFQLKNDDAQKISVDHSYHAEYRPADADFKKEMSQAVNVPASDNKIIKESKNNRFLIKPYYNQPAIKNAYPKHASPAQGGWASLTTADLFSAANMKDHAEDSYYYDHDGVPAVATRYELKLQTPDLTKLKPKSAEIAHKIGLIDFLINNTHRHKDNILMSQDGTLKALDHEHAFMYDRAHIDYKTPLDFISKSAIGLLSAIGSDTQNAKELADWWHQVGPNVQKSFHKNLFAIKNKELAKFLSDNFKHRADILNTWAEDVRQNVYPHDSLTSLADSSLKAYQIGKPHAIDTDKIKSIKERYKGDRPESAINDLALVYRQPNTSESAKAYIRETIKDYLDMLGPDELVQLYRSTSTNPWYNNKSDLGLPAMIRSSLAEETEKDGAKYNKIKHLEAMIDYMESTKGTKDYHISHPMWVQRYRKILGGT